MVFHPPALILAKAGESGKYKVGLPAWNMVLRGFMSGAYIAMGAAFATACSTGLMATDASLRFGAAGPGFTQLIMGAVFPVGLLITILTGAELFTGDAMLAPMAAFIHKVSWVQVANLWLWVYVGNFIGSVVWAYIMANGPFVSFDSTGAATVTAFGSRAIAIAAAKTSYVGLFGLWSAFIKGIACNWLVNLAVLLGICADDLIGKIFGIWFPVMAFVSCGFEHCVANMYFIPAGIFTQGYITDPAKIVTGMNWISMWTNNLIAVTLGNIVGGMIFVGLLYWIAFRKEIPASR